MARSDSRGAEINTRFTVGAREPPRERNRGRTVEGREGGGRRVYLAQKASNFQRGCKNGVGTRSGRYTRAGCWVYKTPLSFFASYLGALEGVVLTPLSCFPSFSAFLFSAPGKLSADPPSTYPSHCRSWLHASHVFSFSPLLLLRPFVGRSLLFLHSSARPQEPFDPDFSLARTIIPRFTVIASIICLPRFPSNVSCFQPERFDG